MFNILKSDMKTHSALLVIRGPWHDELVHHPAAWGPGGRLLEKAAQGVLRFGGEAKHFHVLEVVLLVEEGFQIHLQQGGSLLTPSSDNNKVQHLCWILCCPHDCLFPHE